MQYNSNAGLFCQGNHGKTALLVTLLEVMVLLYVYTIAEKHEFHLTLVRKK